METMVEATDEEVTIRDDSTHPIKSVGTYTIKLKLRMEIQLKDVL